MEPPRPARHTAAAERRRRVPVFGVPALCSRAGCRVRARANASKTCYPVPGHDGDVNGGGAGPAQRLVKNRREREMTVYRPRRVTPRGRWTGTGFCWPRTAPCWPRVARLGRGGAGGTNRPDRDQDLRCGRLAKPPRRLVVGGAEEKCAWTAERDTPARHGRGALSSRAPVKQLPTHSCGNPSLAEPGG
jgi:hypothetical protein